MPHSESLSELLWCNDSGLELPLRGRVSLAARTEHLVMQERSWEDDLDQGADQSESFLPLLHNAVGCLHPRGSLLQTPRGQQD